MDLLTGTLGLLLMNPYQLTIAHINDHHSHLQAEDTSMEFNGKSTDVELGGFPRVVSKIKEISQTGKNVVKIHAGDAMTGDLYYTLFKGEADAALMNNVCFDAFALGNHEFDEGDAGLKGFLDYLQDTTCDTPVLAANVLPQIGTPLAPVNQDDYISPYTIKTIGGEQVGLIGIDIKSKTQNSSSPLPTTQFFDEVETAQKYIDELTALGVNKIVLVTHYQYLNDLAMAGQLSGADVIIGGDSHTLLGDFEQYDLNPSGDYPTMSFDKDGNRVCVAHAWQYSYLVGELNVTFNGAGEVTSCSGTPHLLLGDSFQREKEELTGTDLAEVEALIAADPQLSIVEPDAAAAALLAGYSDQVDTMKQQVIGTATEDLCLERIPGQGRSQICDVTDTADHGSDISNIVAKAFREMSLTSDIAIQNGGGVRVDIAAGNITLGDAYLLLPFANTLVELSMTGQQIIDVLEDAYDYALDPDGSSGAYPYASGLRWDLDGTQPKGSRFSSVEVQLKGEATWSPISLTTTYKVVTNNYIAGGKDGYLTFGNLPEAAKVDTYLDYAQSFVDYAEIQGSLSKLPVEEYSTQSYTPPVL